MTTAPRGWRREQLAYCSNVHPGESLEAVYANLVDHIDAVRRRCGLERLNTGLWLSGEAAERLLNEDGQLKHFSDLLARLQLDLTTFNGFPYGNFHAEAVKHAVYRPDWSDPRRLDYTIALASILSACLSDDHPGGTISSLPLGYASLWSYEQHAKAVDALCKLCVKLDDSFRRGNAPVQVCLEMEPGCVLESTADAIRLFERNLRPAAEALGLSLETLHRHIGVCFDVCHQAVQFEDVYTSLQRLHDAGVPVGKIQLSSALDVPQPAASRALLNDFCEPRYLHQTRRRAADGSVHGVDDLPDALSDNNEENLADSDPWRVHFHLPLQVGTLEADGLGTTRDSVERVFDWLAQPDVPMPHLEVETYTWHVLPPSLRPTDDESLHRGIAAELAWASGALDARGLLMDN
ncbi:MAG: metabolite traffic protein EboE [Pseudomonadota bacterium]